MFKKGQTVRIFNRTLGGKRIFEGIAIIKEINQGDNQGIHAEVEFKNEKGRLFSRWIFASDHKKIYT